MQNAEQLSKIRNIFEGMSSEQIIETCREFFGDMIYDENNGWCFPDALSNSTNTLAKKINDLKKRNEFEFVSSSGSNGIDIPSSSLDSLEDIAYRALINEVKSVYETKLRSDDNITKRDLKRRVNLINKVFGKRGINEIASTIVSSDVLNTTSGNITESSKYRIQKDITLFVDFMGVLKELNISPVDINIGSINCIEMAEILSRKTNHILHGTQEKYEDNVVANQTIQDTPVTPMVKEVEQPVEPVAQAPVVEPKPQVNIDNIQNTAVVMVSEEDFLLLQIKKKQEEVNLINQEIVDLINRINNIRESKKSQVRM